MVGKDFKPPRLTRPTWVVYLQRTLAILFLPLTAAILISVVIGVVATLGQRAGLIYMGTEALFLGLIPFTVAATIALVIKWTVSKKAALRVFYIALTGLMVFVGTAAVFETINTKPIASAASEFRELPGLTRELGNNGDKFSPAPGFIPCIDIMGEGCPNITRTWLAAPGQELTVQDLQKVLDDSGWKGVKIKADDCDMTDDAYYPGCTAEGMVGDYKVTVRIVKISDHWELRMYLRLPTNVR